MKRSTLTNWLLGLGAVALVVVPLVFVQGDYAGADDQAVGIVEQTHPGYRPWFAPIFEPPSEEVASGLFAMQAAIGAGVLGYFFGRAHGRRSARKDAGGQTAQPDPTGPGTEPGASKPGTEPEASKPATEPEATGPGGGALPVPGAADGDTARLGSPSAGAP